MKGLTIAWFGSSLLSAYWNGAATYYRGIIRALHQRGHRVHFFEPDAFDRQRHRDLDPPPWAEVTVYPATPSGLARALERARGSDLVIKASGVGVFDRELEQEVVALAGPTTMVGFWDVDAPATLDRLAADPDDPFHALVPRYDLVLTYGGGPRVRARYLELGARACAVIYNGFDPTTHHPVAAVPALTGDLTLLANRLPDRERQVDAYFVAAAAALPERRFLLGGAGWDDKPLPANVTRLGHVPTARHNALNCSPRAVLNLTRDSMVRYGYSPATRVFEAAAAGACLITDAWEGIDRFLEPGAEILVADGPDAVVEHLAGLTRERATAIGQRARARMLAEHRYEHRAQDVERALGIVGDVAPTTRPQPTARPEPAARPVARPEQAARGLDVVVLGLALTSSWGNGHATTYRALLRALADRGHRIQFLERDREWYARHRDLADPEFCEVHLYASLAELRERHRERVRDADAVIVGSYVPEGREVCAWTLATARGVTAFYDIDTPVTLAKLAAGGCDYLDAAQIPRFDAYLSFTGGPILRRLTVELGSPRALPLYCSVDAASYAPGVTPACYDLSYMGTYSPDRQPSLDALLLEPARRAPTLRFCIAGAQYPAPDAWPANVEPVEHLPPSAHPGFYARSRFTLNVTRRAMIAAGYSPSVRLFEAAACGTPILSDAWPGLDELFELGREIIVVRSPSEVLAALRELPEPERRALADRARARVLAEHTAERRAQTLERYLVDLLATHTR